MKKPLILFLSISALLVSGTFIASATTSNSSSVVTAGDEAEEVPPCQSKPKTSMLKAACKKGGQKAAKKAMKTWTKKVKKAKKAAGETGFKLTCKACHSSMKGAYPLKADGMSKFKELDKWLKTQK